MGRFRRTSAVILHQKTSNLELKQGSYELLKVAPLCGGGTGAGRRGDDFPVTGTWSRVYPLNYTLYNGAAAALNFQTQSAAHEKSPKKSFAPAELRPIGLRRIRRGARLLFSFRAPQPRRACKAVGSPQNPDPFLFNFIAAARPAPAAAVCAP